MDNEPENKAILVGIDKWQLRVGVHSEILAILSRAEITLLVADHLRRGVIVEEVPKIEPPVLVVPEKYKNFHEFTERKRKPARKGRNKWYRSMK